jgi:penicillin-binding protein 1A
VTDSAEQHVEPEEGGEPSVKPKKKRWWLRLFVVVAVMGVLGAGGVGYMLWHFSRELPRIDSMADYHPPLITRLWDKEGTQLLAAFFDERRTLVPVKSVPQRTIDAFLAAEDADFYSHRGVDYLGIIRAALKNLTGGRKQGASTITQQTARAFLLTRERTYSRKIKEILLTWRIEDRFEKDGILFLYLNHIYFGAGNYGVLEASRHYFGKEIGKVTLAESAMLASLPKSPNGYNPLRFPEKAMKRRNWVLDMMVKKKFVSAAEGAAAKLEKLNLVAAANPYLDRAPYYAEHVRQLLEEEYGRDTLYRDGLDVRTSIDLRLQVAARLALRRGLENIDRAQGYRGPLWRPSDDEEAAKVIGWLAEAELAEGRLLDLSGLSSAAVAKGKEAVLEGLEQPLPSPNLRVAGRIVEMNLKAGKRKRQKKARVDLGGGFFAAVDLGERAWQKPVPNGMARVWGKGQNPYKWLKVGDVVRLELIELEGKEVVARLIQKPKIQGALVAIDPQSRDVRAMVGGYDFRDSPFNRAGQGRRQPGSAFKPIVYAAGLQSRRFTPATLISDSPKVFRNADSGNSWKPKNYGSSFEGDISMRYCLTHSKNTCSIQIAESVGVSRIISLARGLGIKSHLPPDLTLSLGSGEVLPFELTNAYASLAAGGRYAEPVFMASVKDRFGDVLLKSETRLKQVIEPALAYLTTSLMRSVVESGTARSIRKLGRPVAGKTGTTNEQRSAWFMGFTPELAVGVYVGYDNNDPMGHGMTGGGIAAPIWLAFMQEAMTDVAKSNFVAPPGISIALIDPKTGMLAPPDFPGARRESFLTGTAPREMTSMESQLEGMALDEEY